jgi:CDP-diacylglycerol---glycerol-3-phosphate 3-phosphatidyltransferase
MFTLSNILSFIRAPLALVFLQKNITFRIIAIVVAMLSDSIDGYLARKYKSASKFGAILDPAMDKFFVYFVLTILYLEGSIKLWEGLAFLSRDFALCIYGIYLLCFRKFSDFKIHAIRWGKVSTALQFLFLIGITANFKIPSYLYFSFILLGLLSLKELYTKRE